MYNWSSQRTKFCRRMSTISASSGQGVAMISKVKMQLTESQVFFSRQLTSNVSTTLASFNGPSGPRHNHGTSILKTGRPAFKNSPPLPFSPPCWQQYRLECSISLRIVLIELPPSHKPLATNSIFNLPVSYPFNNFLSHTANLPDTWSLRLETMKQARFRWSLCHLTI